MTDPEWIYHILTDRQMERIKQVRKRLYSEDRFKADEMRDLAQTLDLALDDAYKFSDSEFALVKRAKNTTK